MKFEFYDSFVFLIGRDSSECSHTVSMGCYCILRSYSVLSFWLVVVQQWYSKFYLKGYMPWFECASQRRFIAINKRKAFDHYLGKHYEALKIIAAKCAMLSYTVDPIIHAYVLLCSDFGGYVIIRSGWVKFVYTHSSSYVHGIGKTGVVLKDAPTIDLYK